jgi:hypothetical protein
MSKVLGAIARGWNPVQFWWNDFLWYREAGLYGIQKENRINKRNAFIVNSFGTDAIGIGDFFIKSFRGRIFLRIR